jgi:HEAT repeat protein
MSSIISQRFVVFILFAWMPVFFGTTTAPADNFDRFVQDLRNPEWTTRRSAVKQLGKLGDNRAVGPLIACLKDEDVSVRSSAAEALTELGQPTVKPLIACLKDEDSAARYWAVVVLGKLGDKRAVDPLITCLKDKDSKVRFPASEALGQLGDMRAVEPLIVCLKDDDSVVRCSAAEALGRLGDMRAVEPLGACLEDEGWRVRDSSTEALVKLGKPAVEVLIPYLKHNDGTVRRSIAEALAKLGDARAVEPLIACLKDIDGDIRKAVAEALGRIGDKRAVVPLSTALPDWDAKLAIGKALLSLGWQPETVNQQVYLRICTRDRQGLSDHWEQTTQVLFKDLKSGDRRKMENAVFTFIVVGKKEVIADLIRILDADGNKEMAETYVNCGDQELDAAARSWASRHGYSIYAGDGAHKASWGRW